MQQVFYFLFFLFMSYLYLLQCQGVVFTQVSQHCALTTKARSLFSVLKLINLRLLIAIYHFYYLLFKKKKKTLMESKQEPVGPHLMQEQGVQGVGPHLMQDQQAARRRLLQYG